MSYLSDGPFSYNRFNDMDRAYKSLYEKKAKPDFLDMDKDGDKKESMKKASKDKKEVKEGSMPPWLKDKKDEKGEDKKDSKKDDKKDSKKDCKEQVISYLQTEGFVSNEVSAEVLYNHMSSEWRSHLEGVVG